MNSKKKWVFLIVCLFLAVLAEISLFSSRIGISYSVFIGAFYTVFFYYYRRIPFQQKQISSLFFIAILLLTITYAIYSNPLFYAINSMIIPIFVFAHTILLTNTVPWYSISFFTLLVKKVKQIFKCGKLFSAIGTRQVKRKVDQTTYQTGKKIGLGVLISLPLLLIITTLLSAADEKFADLLFIIPEKIFSLDLEVLWDFLKIFIMTVGFYCYFEIVTKKTKIMESSLPAPKRNWDTIIITTILIFVNLVYLLFAFVQFQYLFSGTLQEGFSYAEYARRGFFELLLVTVINYVILITTIIFAKNNHLKIIKVLLTLLIAFSGVLLASAFLRLMLYEQAYGFTTLRVLAHSFMIFLFIIFAFTLVKVWINRLPLVRFYVIASVVYYVGLNIVGIDQLIVSKNIERYETSQKIDIEYLGQLSYSAIPPLVELYRENPDILGLKTLLLKKQEQFSKENETWQSFNLSRERAKKALKDVR